MYKYGLRKPPRYNTSGQFVSAGELVPGASQLHGNFAPMRNQHGPGNYFGGQQQQQQQEQEQQQQQQQQYSQQPQLSYPQPQPQRKQKNVPQNMQENKNMENMQNMQTLCDDDGMKVKVDMDASSYDREDHERIRRPPWWRFKLAGVKKISNRERRRRQNENLRRLLSPKNALMVLNEMMPTDQLANQFKVEPAAGSNQYYKPNTHSFCADLTLEGKTYKGYGDNKLTARNAAAEQAIRDLIIKRMNKVINSDASQNEDTPEEETLPMIQLASFALHKLFSEWEYEGHKVPPLKQTPANSTSDVNPERAESPGAGKRLPLNAAAMHPCMLLTYMRPRLEYRELAADGDKPQNMVFTIGVDVDGTTYIGKASNKREARRAAARSACQQLFGVTFDDVTTASTPLVSAD